LVFNKPLCIYIQELLRQRNLDRIVNTKTWHSWLYKQLIDLGRNPKDMQIREYVYDWNQVKRVFDNALIQDPQKIFRNLFIDEAQDFPKDLLEILKGCYQNATIFADEHQSVDHATPIVHIRQATGIEKTPYTLTKNYRNTPEIYEIARLFFTGDPHDFPDTCYRKSNGFKPSLIVSDYNNTIKNIINYGMNYKQQIIGVVLPNSELRERYYSSLSHHSGLNVQQYKRGEYSSGDFNFSSPGIKLLTIKTVKGLEFDTVFICDIDD